MALGICIDFYTFQLCVCNAKQGVFKHAIMPETSSKNIRPRITRIFEEAAVSFLKEHIIILCFSCSSSVQQCLLYH